MNLFQRYLFVRFDEKTSPWHKISNILGVSDLIRFGNVLAIMPEVMVDKLKKFELPTSEMFIKGETLKVTDGPFKDLEVIYQLKNGNQRVIVLVEILNKIQKISLAINSLKNLIILI